MTSRTKNWAVRNTRQARKNRRRDPLRKLLVEQLEDRRLLASYNWDGAGTLSIALADNEDLTIAEAGGDRTFTIDSGTFTASNVAELTGEGTAMLTFDGGEDISVLVSVANAGPGPGATNNVTFAGGTLTTAQLTVNANAAGTTSAIDFTGAMTLAGDASLTANGAGITDSTGSVVVTGTTTLQATGQDIVLDAAGNSFAMLNVNNADHVTLADSNGIDLDYLNVSGNLVVTAGAGITDSVASFVTVLGTASFTAGGGSDIVLDNFPDLQGAIDLTTTGNATVANFFAADLAASTVGGNLAVSTLAGDILVNGKLTVGGTVALTAAGGIQVNADIDPTTVTMSATDDILVNAAVQATDGITVNAGTDGTGGVNVTATGSLTTTVAGFSQLGVTISTGGTSGDVLLTGDITTADGPVTVISNAGDMTMADGSVIDAGSGAIMLIATGDPNVGLGDITLGLVTTTSAGPFAVFVNAYGAVIDADAGAGMDLAAPNGDLFITATNGVGTLAPDDAIEFRASTLDVMNQASGDISMWTDRSVNILSAFQTTSTGSIEITASNAVTSPTITVSNSGVQTATGPGGVKLVAEGPTASILLNAIVSTDTGDLLLWADHDIIAGVNVFLQAADVGNIEVYANHDNSNNPGLNDDGTIQFSAALPTDISILAGNANTVSFWLGDCDGFIEGSISAANEVSKRGRGILRLNGPQNNYVGPTHIYDGGLLINGALTNTGGGTSPGVIHVYSSLSSADPGAGAGLLGGTGLIQDDTVPTAGVRDVLVHAGGTLDPGDIDPITCEHLPGTLEIWGDVVFDANSTYRLQLDGLYPGDGAGFHDQLVVHGTVSFTGNPVGSGGANLVGEITYDAPVGSRWEVVENDAVDSDPITTRFQGIPELGFAVFSGRLVNVSYMDDLQSVFDNDVVLTAPGRYDFNGFHDLTQASLPYDMWEGVSPFQTYPANMAGWVGTLPWYFERFDVNEPGWDELRYDGQTTNPMGDPVTFRVDVIAGQTYEVMILAGDAVWNNDDQSYTVVGTPGGDSDSTGAGGIDTWGAGAPDGSGVQVPWGGGTANPAAGYYRWIHLTVDVGGTYGDTGDITLTMEGLADLLGLTGTASILAMDIRPAESVGEMTLERAEPQGTSPFGVLPADGMTKDRYTGTGAPPNAVLTVTVSAGLPVQYATVSPDFIPAVTPNGDLATYGAQIRADAAGNFEFWVQRPATLTVSAATENWTILVEESTGLSRGSEIQPYEAPAQAAPLRFDFGTATSPVQTYGTPLKDFLKVIPQTIYSATRGYGWATRVAAGDRRDTTTSALRTDFNSGRNATFKVDLPTGPSYSVRLYHSNPLYFGSVPYMTQPFNVIVEGTSYVVPVIPPGTTVIQELSGISVSADGVLEIVFGWDGTVASNFMVAGMDISAGNLPGDTPLLASGDPLDAGAAAISLDVLQPVAAEAAARWSATGLTATQAATLAGVQFTVADLGGAYLGLANPATNTVRIDDDAAMFGWSVVSRQSSVVGDRWSVVGDRLPITDYRLPDPGLDLLTVVMHELGHLLGYEHSEAGLMAPVLAAGGSSAEAVEPLGQALWRTGSSSVIPDLGSRISDPASRLDSVFADLGDDSSSSDDVSPLLASQDTDELAAATVRSGEEATQAKVPRRSRLQRYERELDDWFAQLAAEDVGQ